MDQTRQKRCCLTLDALLFSIRLSVVLRPKGYVRREWLIVLDLSE